MMGKKKKKDNRVRKQYRFWLNVVSDGEYALAEAIEYLKRERAFVGAIRDGLRLLVSLRQGRADVLRELFPNIEEILGIQKDEPSPVSTPEGDLRRDLAEIKGLIRGRVDGYLPPSEVVAAPPIKQYRRDLPPKPVNDLPLLAANEDNDSSANLLDSFL